MSRKYSLLAPGPVSLHPRVKEALAQPMIHHRTPLFEEELEHCFQGLKKVFATEQDVLMHTSTGSGAMESAVVNLFSPGDRVLVIDSGKFGERWAKMCQAYGLETEVLKVPWGEAVDLELLRHTLKTKDFKALLTQACETSTATAHPLAEISALCQEHDLLLLVDGITAVGAYPVPMDELGIDVLVAGSQKAFMIPTGLGFISLSARAWEASKKARLPRFYFDLAAEKKARDQAQTRFSSSVSLVRALRAGLEVMQDPNLEAHYAEIQKRAAYTRELGLQLGLSLFSKSPSESVTAWSLPDSIKGEKLRRELEVQKGITVMGGQDQARGRILRIGHMGYIEKDEMISLAEAMTELFQESDPPAKIPFGSSKEAKAWAEDWWQKHG